jgi:hypothetical protein
MKCPHCLVEFHAQVQYIDCGNDVNGDWVLKRFDCPNPNCKKLILFLTNCTAIRFNHGGGRGVSSIQSQKSERLVLPKGISRLAAPPEVPREYREVYEEACAVLPDSAMASAALSRRCLQQLLRDKGGFKSKNLADEIQMAIDSNILPSHITESIDGIRNIGNFAAHPLKSTNTGEIIPVEPGEAEWNLDVIEFLFDFYFVQPAIIKKRRDALNQKLQDAGKPAMK